MLTDQRSQAMPQVPTAGDAGVPGVQPPSWIGFMAPGGTPRDVVARISRELATVLKSPEITEQFRKLGADTVGDTPEEFARTIQNETYTRGSVIRAGNLKFE